MEYAYLGRTEMQVSRICLGCMSFGTPGWLNWDWVLDEQASEPFFRRALELGITFLIPPTAIQTAGAKRSPDIG